MIDTFNLELNLLTFPSERERCIDWRGVCVCCKCGQVYHLNTMSSQRSGLPAAKMPKETQMPVL